MTSTKTIIEQADEIVGINVEAIGLAPEHKAMLRRGAYFDWLMKNVDADETMVCGTINHTAGWIVRLHAESKPKGDGLPDLIVHGPNMAWHEHVVVRKTAGGKLTAMTLDEQVATVQYINRCLTAPVRRLLSAFDVTDESDRGPGAFALLQKTDGSPSLAATDKWIDEETICCLSPRAKP